MLLGVAIKCSFNIHKERNDLQWEHDVFHFFNLNKKKTKNIALFD